MNNIRRKKLQSAIELMESAAGLVEEVRDEEEETLANIPDNLLGSDRAEKMEECIALLSEVQDELEDRVNEISEL